MGSFLSVIGVVVILSLLVLVHEWGHFMAALKNGIKVDEFGIGFPPKLFSFKGKKTTYTINLIPLGGFVKLHGEDATNKKFFQDKHSFAAKTPWQKVQVVCAGVLMNFLVFWILMSGAIMIGMNPLIVTEEDYREAFANQTFVSEPFLKVKEVVDGSKAQSLGVKANDVLLSLNGESVIDDKDAFLALGEFESDEAVDLSFASGDSKKVLVRMEDADNLEDFGLEFYPSTVLPVLKVTNVQEESRLAGILKEGDKVFAVDGSPVFDFETYLKRVYDQDNSSFLEFEVLRGNNLESFELELDSRQIVAGFVEDSAGEKAGLLLGDKILKVDGQDLFATDSLLELMQSLDKEKLVYEVERGEEILSIEIEPNSEGLVGIIVTPEYKYSDLVFDFQVEYVLSSLVEVKKLKEPFYLAPWVALQEGSTMAVMTAKAFGSALFGVVTNLEVSEEVGGPVQVVKMGSEFMNEGGVALMVFVAMISLSLAVINILPIPALDGGRLFFIIIEAFRGRPLSPKYEALIHFVGFWLLILFIMVVTFYDIVRF